MEITELSVYKGDTYKLELDGEHTYFINSTVVSDFMLRKGGELSGDALSQIQQADTRRKAKKRALYLLGTKQYCYNELYKKLRQTYNEEAAREAADAMRDYGYVNDEEYAPKLADYLIHTKRYGLRKAKYEMLHRGLSAELVENTLAEFSDEEIYEEITELLERKYYAKIQDHDDRRRTIAALARRGYDYNAVKHCIERLLEDYEDYEENEDFE
ncbi:MAG: RecX family transcriptional regulator [Oscillospiraceae bacterium]|nr:RecX family transcriptional regulator [Oscillospiraceae bacterium]